jgi:hypothetical protein
MINMTEMNKQARAELLQRGIQGVQGVTMEWAGTGRESESRQVYIVPLHISCCKYKHKNTSQAKPSTSQASC